MGAIAARTTSGTSPHQAAALKARQGHKKGHKQSIMAAIHGSARSSQTAANLHKWRIASTGVPGSQAGYGGSIPLTRSRGVSRCSRGWSRDVRAQDQRVTRRSLLSHLSAAATSPSCRACFTSQVAADAVDRGTLQAMQVLLFGGKG